ncbi:MAG TPA: hypothetical protein VML91_10960 [Burkholderiales bacterium]|nr:hypothetical protein [Burkholderiales bacterium]
MAKPRRREAASARRYHSPDDEAARLGVSTTLILEACRSGAYPHRRLGARRILIDPAEADAYLAATGASLDQAIQRTSEGGPR